MTASKDFIELIQGLTNKSDWIAWLSKSESKAATETLAFLSQCYSKIPSNKKGKLRKRIRQGDQPEIEAVIYELIAHEFLRRLALQPDWSPIIDKFNPDLGFHSDGINFIADVIFVKGVSKTVRQCGETIEAWDNMINPAESRAKKIADRIVEKTIKYSRLNYPLVVFIFLGDDLLLDLSKVEKALYGMTVGEILLEKHYPIQFEHGFPYPGVFLQHEGQGPAYENLAAVAVCEWFDTLNRSDRGKRLNCVILHNWASNCALPLEAFSDFGQIVWRSLADGRVEPSCVGDTTKVAKFTNDDNLEIKSYLSNSPW